MISVICNAWICCTKFHRWQTFALYDTIRYDRWFTLENWQASYQFNLAHEWILYKYYRCCEHLWFISQLLYFTDDDGDDDDSAGLDTGRVDPRVRSGWVGSEFSANLAGRVGSKFLIWIIFLSASVEFRCFNNPSTSRNVLLCERWRPVWILLFCGLL